MLKSSTIQSILIIVCSILILLKFYALLSAQAHDIREIEMSDTTQKRCEEKIIILTDELQDISITYPQYKSEYDLFNQEIKKVVFQKLNDFRSTVQEELELNTPLDPSWPPFQFTMHCSFKVEHADDDLISILLFFDSYMGGAHGQRFFVSLNYDIENNKMLTIQDLVPQTSLEKLSSLCVEDLEGRGIIEHYEYITPIYENFETVTCTPSTLTIQFDEYQICCYAMGTHSVTIDRKHFE